MSNEGKKFCKDCNAWLDVKLFGNNKNNDDGLAFYCKEHYNERKYASKERTLETDVATLIAEGTIRNTRIERIGADLLLKSCDSRMADEFPCSWDDRLNFARDCILKIDGFWVEWIRLTEIYDKETDPTEKHNARGTIDRIIENPSIGYRLENIQALSYLENTLKTITQRYDIIKWSENTLITGQTRNELLKRYSLDAEELKKFIDGGLFELDGELYAFQSKDRSDGKHSEIIQQMINYDEDIPEEFAMKINLRAIVNVPFTETLSIPVVVNMPFVADKRYVTAKIKPIDDINKKDLEQLQLQKV